MYWTTLRLFSKNVFNNVIKQKKCSNSRLYSFAHIHFRCLKYSILNGNSFEYIVILTYIFFNFVTQVFGTCFTSECCYFDKNSKL